jgi:hypothetical protein
MESEFRFGFDLFNAGFYWEAHEAWETVWHAVGRTTPLADRVKGLIRMAAAGVKVLEGQPVGVRSHLTAAERLMGADTVLALPPGAREPAPRFLPIGLLDVLEQLSTTVSPAFLANGPAPLEPMPFLVPNESTLAALRSG